MVNSDIEIILVFVCKCHSIAIFLGSGSGSDMVVAGGSNECQCIEYYDDDRIENNENSIHIHVTNTDGIDNHLEEIR